MRSVRDLRLPTRAVVGLAVVGAAIGRAPSFQWPLRPDEAGFLLVARAWQPSPESVFGTYWVDRPPQVIALFGLSDRIGGPYFIRVVGVLAAMAFVLLAAGAARSLADHVGARSPERVGVWVAIAAAALTSHAAIDAVAVKGELLGLPLLMAACWCTVVALRRTSPRWAAAAGLLAVLPMGVKQNLVGALCFGAVLLVASFVAGDLDRRAFGRLAGAAVAGALVPVVATIVWSLAAGVRLSALAYAFAGFRADANNILSAQPSGAVDERLRILLAVALVSGLIALAVAFVLLLPRLVRFAGPLTLAVAAMLLVDSAGVLLSGSYWRTYLLVPIAPALLALALLLAHRLGWLRLLVVAMVVSSVLALVEWQRYAAESPPTEYLTGRAIAAAAEPGDSLVVYGGRADIQWASGLPSPYEHLWSLPMRTLDPELDELAQVLQGPQAPSWFVRFTRLDAWSEAGTGAIREELIIDYRLVTIACGSYRVYLRRDLRRPRPAVDCERSFDSWVWP